MSCPICNRPISYYGICEICRNREEKFRYINDIKYSGFYSILCFILGLSSILFFMLSLVNFSNYEMAITRIYIKIFFNLLGVLFGFLTLFFSFIVDSKGVQNKYLDFWIVLAIFGLIFNIISLFIFSPYTMFPISL